jgi:hypothetical protein
LKIRFIKMLKNQIKKLFECKKILNLFKIKYL